jgi:hypothetical protein
VSERRACRVVRQWRGTQRYLPLRRTDEDQLTQAILALAAKYGRYGYRRITALLQNAGWPVGKDRVQRIWRREGLNRRNSGHEGGCGCRMVRACGYDRSVRIMCGATTL